MVTKPTIWPQGRFGVPQITPYTYRDGQTLLELITSLRDHVVEQLHPNLQKAIDKLVADVETEYEKSHDRYVDGVEEFQRIHDAFMSDVNASLVALNDAAATDVIQDTSSMLRKTLDELFISTDGLDASVAAHVSDQLSDTHSAVNYRILQQVEAPISEVKELVNNIDLETPFEEFKNQEQLVHGDWVFSRGKTENNDSIKLIIERDFYESQGDLFDSKTQLMFTVRNQERTTQNPPGYSSAAIALVEDGSNGEQYQGESARLLFISNRFLFNRRLEVDMGGKSRSTFVSGYREDHQFTELGFHNRSNPRISMFGPDNEARGGIKSKMKLDELGYHQTVPSLLPHFEIRNPEANSGLKQLQIDLLKTGRTRIRHLSKGNVSSTIHWSDNGDITFDGRLLLTAVSALTMTSPDGTLWRVRVSNSGELQTFRV